MIQSQSSGHAKAYFQDALVKADYYLADQEQEITGRLKGKLAERLGLSGPVTKDTFFALCENRNPLSGSALTPRTKDERTVGYDINFHCPKSVSILSALSNDEHILNTFQDCVQQIMQEIEQDTLTRIRKNGVDDERKTGELIYADFIHKTARPVDGSLPDPHLHAHIFIFNATFDDAENQVKAAQFREIQRSMPYYEAKFHKRLSDQLIELGYQIRRTEKSFEIEGVPQHVIDLFSKRTDQIGQAAKVKGITDAKSLSELGARTRSKKQKGHTMGELKANWQQQIRDVGEQTKGEGRQVIRSAPVKDKGNLSPQHCIDHAVAHGFERASVLIDRRLLALAYRHGIGHASVSAEDISREFARDDRFIHVTEKGRVFTTTRQVLAEEQRMVNLARQGQGKLRPLYAKAPKLKLEGQQAEAVSHVLTTTNRVSIVRGVAGSGKTTLMKEAVRHMENAGKQVIVVAPTAQASRGVLREEGFDQASTVAQLLADEKMHEALRGNVLWVDEAGLLGTKDMTALLDLTNQQNARLILSGDTRQHASVVRGDALRILNTVSGIQSAEVSKIYRQRDNQYRSAVEDLTKGDVHSAFEKLDALGSLKSVDPLEPNKELVQDYIGALRQGKSALVVSPTHEQGEAVTKDIREQMQASGLLSKKEIAVSRLTNLNLTEAQKSDWRNFKPGNILQFNQNRTGIKRGSLWTIESSTTDGVIMRNEQQQTIALPLEKSNDFDLYEKGQIPLAKGDHIRITRNGFDQERNRLNNGQMLEVTRLTKQGEIILRNRASKAEYRLNKDFGHLAHAYCVTSHASQGKTVDEVFISQPTATFAATNAKQFYVSVSRARDKAHIYTDDKQQLMHQASELGDRQSALELVGRKNVVLDRVHDHIRQNLERTPKPRTKQTELVKSERHKDRDYEPRL
ncbi:relaxase domain-containing protein [Spirosoma sp. RP8]|uniref:Relaxase domain-containing protein n=1 Tax=Spirosoma liriopis TaxID=2937440 RepID=A0ABT0HIC4_9BACT|nr:MobF family relaxase [Spirosoma liriopis]MCK8491755.1 relaxase domain-containing protein [Spirosoma liriopis]